jgi:putative SOS response-associated peptidase YedK
MPALLTDDELLEWLDPELRDPGKLQVLLKPSAPGLMESWRVSRLVNNFRNEGPELIKAA